MEKPQPKGIRAEILLSSYTPGPWEYTERIDEGFRVHLAGHSMADAIADIDEWNTPETTEANARLIAAAPELVDALRFAVLNADKFSECDPDGTKRAWIDAARALLARIAA